MAGGFNKNAGGFTKGERLLTEAGSCGKGGRV